MLRNFARPYSAEAKLDHESLLSLWSENCISDKNMQGVKTYVVCQSDGFHFNVNKLLYSNLDSEKVVLPNPIAIGNKLVIDADNMFQLQY